ncbi:hypothetical protein SmJEL517_g01683 [Synchytrium microbalum]|uniref:THUMP domain-containing protein n=1 Tax=Synchytrium microbalum TaxID=1806994 RepID=A0A507CEM0_9FUNG|nr:uncharacterized protein SmJEL517_g01683 [Synchytrium microbalum]TPX35963.1 hypothetical protein SmJEL517_g01683 [Synchytrium microbalum]
MAGGGASGSKRGGGGAGGKKKFYSTLNTKSKAGSFKAGIENKTAGILISCAQGKETKAATEIRNWLKEIADRLYGPEEAAEEADTKDGDVEKALQAELDGLKKERREWRFQQVLMKSDSMIYFKTIAPVNPVEVVTELMESVLKTGSKRSRHCIRIIPIQETCYASVEEISKVVSKLAKPVFDVDGDETVIKWALVQKVRSHAALTGEMLIESIPGLIPKRHKVDLTTPEVCIVVEVVKTTACISILRNFKRFKRFNLRSIWDDMHPDEKAAIEAEKAAKKKERSARGEEVWRTGKKFDGKAKKGKGVEAEADDDSDDDDEEVEASTKNGSKRGADEEGVEDDDAKEEDHRDKRVKEDVKEDVAE